MFVRKQKRKGSGRTYLSVCRGYRDEAGKARNRHVAGLGYLDALAAEHGEIRAQLARLVIDGGKQRLHEAAAAAAWMRAHGADAQREQRLPGDVHGNGIGEHRRDDVPVLPQQKVVRRAVAARAVELGQQRGEIVRTMGLAEDEVAEIDDLVPVLRTGPGSLGHLTTLPAPALGAARFSSHYSACGANLQMLPAREDGQADGDLL